MNCPECNNPITIEETPLGNWDASCDSCGWFSGTVYDTEEKARERLAELLKAGELSDLRDVARELLHLHLAEMEGIQPPTPEQWEKAVERLAELLDNGQG
jgi:hypothetical protein